MKQYRHGPSRATSHSESEAHDRSRPSSRGHGRDPGGPGRTPPLCPSPSEGPKGFTRPIRHCPFTPSHPQSPVTWPRRRRHRPAFETPRAPPIPIAGRRLRSIRLFHASRNRVPSCFILGGAPREKALFIMSGPRHARRRPSAGPTPGTPVMMATLRAPLALDEREYKADGTSRDQSPLPIGCEHTKPRHRERHTTT